jgi:integrase
VLNPAGPDHMDAPPRIEQKIEPLTTKEWQAVMAVARGTTNSARWTVALALGLRQGEALGLRWADVDLDEMTLSVRQTLMRLPGRGIVFGEPKSKESRRTVALPPQFVPDMRAHRKAEAAKKLKAGDQWHNDAGLVFTLDDGRPIDPRVDLHRWKALLAKAGVRDYRLHAARHTSATIQIALGVPLEVVKANLGHSQLATTLGYTKVVDELQRDAAKRVGAAMWGV